jgi:hypothetical protein
MPHEVRASCGERKWGSPRSEAMFEKVDDIMATYIDAVEEFSKSAKAFLQHVDLLARAWNAYQESMTASAELRTILDNSDETVRMLMTQLEQAVSSPFGKPVLDEKNPELLKVEAMKASGGSSVVRTFP